MYKTIIAMILILLFFSFMSVKRNRVWKNSETLWADSIKKTPESYLGRYQLGLSYVENEKYDEAYDTFMDMLSTRDVECLHPQLTSWALQSLGNIHILCGRWTEATNAYALALMMANKVHYKKMCPEPFYLGSWESSGWWADDHSSLIHNLDRLIPNVIPEGKRMIIEFKGQKLIIERKDV